IVSSLLSHTAVADNIDSAIAISKRFGHRFKVVTLDGQVMNAGGSMTGGSRGQNAGILSRGNDIEELKSTVKKLQADYDARQEQHKNMLSEVSAAQADYDGVLAELQKAQEEKIRRESELRLINDKVDTAVSALNDLEAEKRNSAERTAKLEEDVKKAQEKIDKLNSDAQEVRDRLASFEERRAELVLGRENNAEAETSINLQIVELKKDIQAKEEFIEGLRRRKSSHEGHADELSAEISEINAQMAQTAELISRLTDEAAALRSEAAKSKEDIAELAQKRSDVEGESTRLRACEREKNSRRELLSGERARLEERRDVMQHELEDAQNKLFDEYQLTRREALELGIVIEDAPKAQRTLNEIKAKIRALGSVNVGAIEEYKEVSERYGFMKSQIDDIESSRAELIKMITDLTGKMSERFREQFNRINTLFGQTFAELFGGGKAELILENPLDVLECAIDIKVQPPGKNVQNIDLLSGGEKGLAAIALLFSILKVTPAPFCIFDEVEAALDDVNVTRYAQYVRRMTKNTQFILITHRRGTMEEADVLYGVTMQEDGVSKLLELKTADMAKKLGLT
ncbi:MAG: chromosome segregation protein SMC, partial [Clostridia bacterium]|nr:chromosome segregation protein SMC [Clostridia bacterium]